MSTIKGHDPATRPFNLCTIEDNPAFAERLLHIFNNSAEFHLQSQFSNAEQALQRLPDLRPHLVLVDMDLPGMSGADCIYELRKSEQLKQTRIVVLTMFEDEDYILQSIQNGANGYLLKDIGPDLLLAELKVACLGGSSMSQTIAERIFKNFQSTPRNQIENPLTVRETEVINLISLGFTYQEIADELDLSAHTVRRHIEKIYRKLEVGSRSQAIRRSRQLGLLQLD